MSDAPKDPEAEAELRRIMLRGHVRSFREGAATWISVVVGIVVFCAVLFVCFGALDATGTGTRGTGWLAIAISLGAASTVGGVLRRFIKPKPLD